MTLVTCDIGNPLRGGANLRLFITIMPGSSLVGNEMGLDVGLALASINPGSTDALTAMGEVFIRAEANALIDPIGLVNYIIIIGVLPRSLKCC